MRFLVFLCTFLLSLQSLARMVPRKDPLNGVLDADLVVIVQPWGAAASKSYRVSEVFWGTAKVGDLLDLGNFQLEVVQESGPPLVEPTTPETRILLFLHHPRESPTQWEPTDFQSAFFWASRTQEAVLRRAAERAVELRRAWEQAASIADAKMRAAALWPYLDTSTYGVSFLHHTESELKKAKPQSGEYFAQRFDDMSHENRMVLLGSAGEYGSKALQRKVRSDIDLQRRVYEEFVTSFERLPKESDWNLLPGPLKDCRGELYYAVAGLGTFKDREDLPFIREVALWSAKYHLEQTADAALDAFREMPDEKNLAVIDAILKEFLPGKIKGMGPTIDIDAERALCAHKYAETVPLVAPFVSDSFMSSEVEQCLTQIVGQNLGNDPKVWLDWYKVNAANRPPI